MSFTLEQVLESAASHPFYSNGSLAAQRKNLSDFPPIEKSELHDSIQTAIRSDPKFLRSVYVSPTSGSSGAVNSLFFITDTRENRRQREKAGQLMGKLGTIEENDIFLNVHGGMALYRSLDLTGDLIEYGGGTNIPAGADISDERLVYISGLFPTINAITGTSSRLITFARYLLSKPELNITFSKVLYSSEPLPVYQEAYLREAFGCDVVGSIYGSAECGPWCASLLSSGLQGSKPYREFAYEVEMMVVEIMDDDGILVKEGEIGEIVVTSLMKLRNPLVRYRTGDVGSLHQFTLNGDTTGQYKCLRLYGRHPGKSFHLNGEKFDLVEIEKVMGKEQWGVLEWQVILDSDHTGAIEESVEFRVVLKNQTAEDEALHGLRTEILEIVGGAHYITAEFTVKMVDYKDLEKGAMGNKIRKIIDKR